MLLTSSDTKRTRTYLFLFTNSAQRELVSICAQSNMQLQITFLALYPWSYYSLFNKLGKLLTLLSRNHKIIKS